MFLRSILQLTLWLIVHSSLSKPSCGQLVTSAITSFRDMRIEAMKRLTDWLPASGDSMFSEALTALTRKGNNARPNEALGQFATLIASPFGPLAFPYSLDFKLPFNLNNTYDYIIVGAGSAGSTLASRLTEDPNVRVLVLEAGGEENIFNNIPLLAFLQQKSVLDWTYESTPQTRSAFGLNGKKIPVPRGKVVGGGSSINYMLYVRGNKLDYDRWAELGAEGWDYASVSPYFVKMEESRDPRAEQGYHGTTGPLTVSPVENLFPVDTSFLEGCRQYGLKIGDFNGADQERFKFSSFTTRDGKRCSTGRAYLGPASFRPNLQISLFSRVNKVLFDDSEPTKQAIGVEFTNDGQLYQVFAGREVILSAGAINTPQLLMLSGIGPRDQLTKFGIPILRESPGVGSNLYDHPFTLLMFTTRFGSSFVLERISTILEAARYLASSTGPLGEPGLNVMGFWRSPYAMDERPDIQIHEMSCILGGAFPDFILGHLFNVNTDIYTKYLLPYAMSDGTMYLVTLVRPRSTGTVKLKSDNPRDAPLIDFNLFEDPRDIDALVEGCKLILNISRTPAMQALNITRFTSELAECSQYPFDSDPYLRCLVQTLTWTVYHASCTAKMGSADDPMAVVDPYLRVYGFDRLRIVDASVMPQVVGGNTNAPTIMIAERAADLIKGRVLRPQSLPFTNEKEILSNYVPV